MNPNGTLSNWATFQVTAQSSGIAAPALSLPPDGSTGISTSPIFSWNLANGAKNYWLTVATSAAVLPTNISTSSCPSCTLSIPLTTTSYQVPAGKPSIGQKYYWQVQSYDKSGTPSILGPYSAQWSFTTEEPGASALSVTTSSFDPPTATVGTAYGAQQAMAASGGTIPYTWSVSGQPSGMSINASTGALYGAPTAAGTFNLTVTVRDSSSPQLTTSKVLSFAVVGAITAISITTSSFNPPTATVGTAYGAQQAVVATGGTTPYTWSVSGQPSGMSMNATTGALYGAPTASGTFNLTVTAKDSYHEHRVQPNNGNGRNRVFGAAGRGGDRRHITLHLVCFRPAQRDVDERHDGRALWRTDGFWHIQPDRHRQRQQQPATDGFESADSHCLASYADAFDHEHWIQPDNRDGRSRVFSATGHDGHGRHHPIHMVCLWPAKRDVDQRFVGRALRRADGERHIQRNGYGYRQQQSRSRRHRRCCRSLCSPRPRRFRSRALDSAQQRQRSESGIRRSRP